MPSLPSDGGCGIVPVSEPDGRTRRPLTGAILVGAGILVLAGLAAFVSIAVGYRHSFTASDMPFGDLVEATVMLSPILILGLLLLGYGHRLMRKG